MIVSWIPRRQESPGGSRADPGILSGLALQSLSLVDELVLTLLDEESGYFRQVPGWNLNCTIVGGALAELSLRSRIDSDLESLILLDPTATGDPVLDLILEEVAAEPEQWNAQYWIERLAPRAEKIIDLALERLVESGVLQYHEGGFWSLTPIGRHGASDADGEDGTAAEYVKERLRKEIFSDEVPDLRDAIIVSLIESCGVLRFIFDLDEEAEKRVEAICRIDLIGRAISLAVDENIAGRLFRPSALTKPIQVVPLRRLLRGPHVRDGNLPALVAGLAAEYGPVFELRLPLRERMIVLAGPETNRWMHRHGRTHLRARGLSGGLREDLRRLRDPAGTRRRRPFPLPQGNAAELLPHEAGAPAGRVLPAGAGAHGDLDRRRDPPGGRHVPEAGQCGDVAPGGRHRFAGRGRRPSHVQGTSAPDPHREDPPQVHALHAGNEAPGEAAGRRRGQDHS